MPHLILEYSANLEPQVDIVGLLRTAHDAALATQVFPLSGMRSRAVRREICQVADGNPANAFVHVTLRLAHGHDQVTKQRVGEDILAALEDDLAAAFASTPLCLSLELQELDPMLNFKRDNLQDHLRPQ